MNNSRTRVEFKGSCLKQNKITFTPRNVVNLFIVYELDRCPQDLNADFTLKDSLFGAVTLTKNADPDKYSYSGYGIGFDSRLLFSFTGFNWDKNVVIFGVNNSSSVHIDNEKKDILVLGEIPTQRLDDNTIRVEAKYSINSSKSQRKFCLSLHYNGSNSFLFVSATNIYQFKAISVRPKVLKLII